MALVFGVSFGGVGVAGLAYGLRRMLNPPAGEDEE
jgi:hypothetical protein